VDSMVDLESVVGQNKMVEVWGMTETSPLITVNPGRGRKKLGSVGLPLPNTEFRIVALEDGAARVPMGEEGEFLCSGPPGDDRLSEQAGGNEKRSAGTRRQDLDAHRR
jgi:long-chain acyl-CoA synthetase